MPEDLRTDRPPPGHLRQMPVVLFSDPGLVPWVLAGVRRAGRDPRTVELPEAAAPTLLGAADAGTEVAVASSPPEALGVALNLVRTLGGRAIPVLDLLPGSGPPRITPDSLSLLGTPDLLDLNVPVPAIADDAWRQAVWDQLRGAELETRHHLVEVDGSSALAERREQGGPPPDDPWRAHAAGAAGVLAGRLAAANRRWREPLEH